MTEVYSFKMLLEAKDQAIAEDAKSDKAVEAAKAGFDDAVKKKDASREAVRIAHANIADRLNERGHHSLSDDKGTVTIYHKHDNEVGWISYQPIPGDEGESNPKAKK